MYFGNQGNTMWCFSVATVACLFFIISLKSGSNAKSLRLRTLGLPSVTLCIGGIYEVKNTHRTEVWKYDSLLSQIY